MADRDERRALAAAANERLVEALDAVLGDRFVAPEGAKPDYYADGIVVDAFALVERCARRGAVPAQDFEESVATARRRVGLAALRRLGDDASTSDDVAAAVLEVVGDGSSLGRGLTEWLGHLDRAGRAAAAAAAITWAESVLRMVGRDPGIRWADSSSSSHWNVPGRCVRLTARHDAQLGGVVSGEKLLLVADGAGGPGDRLRAGYLALVRSLGSQHAPVRVTLAAPSSGDLTRVEVDESLLALATDRLAEHVAARAAPESAPVWVSKGCAYCHLLEQCPEGLAHLGAGRSGDSVGPRASTQETT